MSGRSGNSIFAMLRLPKVAEGRQRAKSQSQEPRAKSQKPKAKSQKPKAKSQKPMRQSGNHGVTHAQEVLPLSPPIGGYRP
jgi:hypothetical protein